MRSNFVNCFYPYVSNSEKARSALGLPAGSEPDPTLVAEWIRKGQASVVEAQHTIQAQSGEEVFDGILADIQTLKTVLFGGLGVIVAAMDAATWLNEHMHTWLGLTNVADTLAQSVPHNVTSEMGLDLLDVADVIRPYPDIIA